MTFSLKKRSKAQKKIRWDEEEEVSDDDSIFICKESSEELILLVTKIFNLEGVIQQIG